MAPRTVLITGCSSGIGLATAVLLAKEEQHDFKVYATMRNLGSKGELEAAAGDTLNRTLFIRVLDVTKEATISSVVDEIVRENGRIDVLGEVFPRCGFLDDGSISEGKFHRKIGININFINVNNAGYNGVDGIDHKPLEWCQAMMDTNYWGVVRTTRAVLPAMKKQKSGRILNVTSIVGVIGAPFFTTYTSSKFAVEGYSEAIAPVLRDGYNIRVSMVEPGPVNTHMATYIMDDQEKNVQDFDDIIKKMYFRGMNRTEETLGSIMQSPDEIAQLHLEIILSDNPHLRYQTNDLMTNVAASKLKDVTTDALLDALNK